MSDKGPEITVKLQSDRLRIFIGGLLHVSIDIRELVAIQSWKFGDYRFSIEYTMKTTAVETWYVSREMWESILKGLDAIHLV